MKILIVDDSKSIHAYLRDLLEAQKHILTHAYNGKEAVDLCTSGSGAFDIILLDWEMPILTGPETLRELKRTSCPASIIMMTSHNKPEEIQSMLEAGAAEYIMKPFTDDIVLQKLEDVAHA